MINKTIKVHRNGSIITRHFTPVPGYESLLERVFGREMRIKKGLGETVEYSTNKAGQTGITATLG